MTLRFVGTLAISVSTILTGTVATAQVQTITATHTYVMGDRDSKEDARALCYMAAKRKVLEEAGVLIESVSEVKNLELTKDQITSYAAAILSAKVVKEEFTFKNGTLSLMQTVKADVDMEEVRKRLADIVANKGLQTDIQRQQLQIRQLEEKVQALSKKLGGAGSDSKEEVRKNRDAELVAYYRLDAERGEAVAQYYLGLRYFVGNGVSKDFVQAVTWFRNAAEQGLADAQFFLGGMYDMGTGVPQDYVQAVAWFRKAAEQGFAHAQNNLGRMYAKGTGVLKDDKEAVKWYRHAAEQGNAEAQLSLGQAYAEGKGVPQDITQAVAWYGKSAEQGLDEAQYALGIQYIRSKDFKQAAAWFSTAAEHGLAKAQLILGALYDSGEGVPQDRTQAVAWYCKAAEQGFAKAQGSLGLKYAAGMGVPKDYVQAYKWFNLAAANGDTESIEYRNKMAQQLTAAQFAEAQRLSREWQTAFEQHQAKK
jgi:TPR repeat protein